MDKSKYGVHASHCCVLHGCKYGNDDCPVVNKIVEQEYLCEYCSDNEIISLKQLKEISNAKFKVGDKIKHYNYGRGIILGNYHKRGNCYYWHIKYENNTYGYNSESCLSLIKNK